jgi:hypothetical protein
VGSIACSFRRVTYEELAKIFAGRQQHTLASIDGVFAGPETRRFYDYRDDAYYRDGLGLLVSCDAMLMGRASDVAVRVRRGHLWAGADRAAQSARRAGPRPVTFAAAVGRPAS